MPEYLQQQAQKEWQQLSYKSAQEQRITVLGTGELGLSAINALVNARFNVNAWSRTEKNIDNVQCFFGEQGLAQVLVKTDILISLLPLTPQTKYILDIKTLSLIPKGGQIINFSRGAVINTEDLVTLLDNNHLKHAVLDVFEKEPLPLNNKLWTHDSITILPHISAPTQRDSAVNVVANNIQCYRRTGIVPVAIDNDRGY
jgi:glyoxylate/hydroxypyruvate reductase A